MSDGTMVDINGRYPKMVKKMVKKMLINWLVKKWEDPMKKMKVDDFSASPKPTEEETCRKDAWDTVE